LLFKDRKGERTWLIEGISREDRRSRKAFIREARKSDKKDPSALWETKGNLTLEGGKSLTTVKKRGQPTNIRAIKKNSPGRREKEDQEKKTSSKLEKGPLCSDVWEYRGTTQRGSCLGGRGSNRPRKTAAPCMKTSAPDIRQGGPGTAAYMLGRVRRTAFKGKWGNRRKTILFDRRGSVEKERGRSKTGKEKKG